MPQSSRRKRKPPITSKELHQCESIDGRELSMFINNSEFPNLCSEFTVQYLPGGMLKRVSCSLMFLAFLLFVLYLNIFCVHFVFIISALLVYQIHHLLWTVQKETLLVVAHVGLQFTTTFSCGYEQSQFIPWFCMSDVIINEAFSFQRVIFYLAVLIRNEHEKGESREIIPLFQYTKPRLKCLEIIYKNIQTFLKLLQDHDVS